MALPCLGPVYCFVDLPPHPILVSELFVCLHLGPNYRARYSATSLLPLSLLWCNFGAIITELELTIWGKL